MSESAGPVFALLSVAVESDGRQARKAHGQTLSQAKAMPQPEHLNQPEPPWLMPTYVQKSISAQPLPC